MCESCNSNVPAQHYATWDSTPADVIMRNDDDVRSLAARLVSIIVGTGLDVESALGIATLGFRLGVYGATRNIDTIHGYSQN